MQINPLLFFIIIIVAVGGGYVFRMLDSRVTTALKEGLEKAPDDEESKPAQKLDEHGVLRVTVDSALRWHLELDGVHLQPDGLTAEQRARLVNVIVQIRPWIDGKTVAALAPATAPLVAPAAGSNLSSSLAVSSAVPSAQPAVPAASTAPRLDIGRGFRSMLENDLTKPEVVKPPSIVSMIDVVLQKKLESSPLVGKRIRLEEGSLGEVVVYVGAVHYSGVDAVPDEDIKSIIRAAIAEWDKK
jgi:hypothetical protein